jgi:hypothetical protein
MSKLAAATMLGLLAFMACLFVVHTTFTFALGAGLVAGGVGRVLLVDRRARAGPAEPEVPSPPPVAGETRE